MPVTAIIHRLTKRVRGSEWWSYKFAPIFATVYATSILLQIAFSELLPFFFFLILALIPGASYVSLLNDFTDLKEDKIAGKENRLEGKTKAYVLALLFVCISAGIMVCFFLSSSAIWFYLSAWIIFTLYSIPPVRLKKRGFLGVIADALGAHVFPQAFTVAALSEYYEKDIDPFWLALVIIWSFFWGMRGILWHQLKDKNNDRIAGIRTFAQRHEDSFIRNLARLIVFPVELMAFLLMLGYARNYLAFVFLAFNILIDCLRYFLWDVKILIVETDNRYRILFNEFYVIFYPFAFLLMGLNYSFISWLVLILHTSLFFNSIYDFCFELIRLFKDSFRCLKRHITNYIKYC